MGGNWIKHSDVCSLWARLAIVPVLLSVFFFPFSFLLSFYDSRLRLWFLLNLMLIMWISSIFCRLILSREFVSNHLVSGINGLSLLIRPCLLYQGTNWNTSQHQSAIRLSFISWLAQTNSFFDLHHTFYLFPFFIVFFSVTYACVHLPRSIDDIPYKSTGLSWSSTVLYIIELRVSQNTGLLLNCQ